MFGSLFGKKKVSITGRVFSSRIVMDAALCDGIRKGKWIAVVFFKSTETRLSALLEDESLRNMIIAEEDIVHGFSRPMLKEFLSEPDRSIVLAERHPLRAHEIELAEKLREQEVALPLIACCSLDDAIMKRFGGERIKDFMKQLGMREDEFMEHGMIEMAIESAQKKIAETAKSDSRADSQEEWLEQNLR